MGSRSIPACVWHLRAAGTAADKPINNITRYRRSEVCRIKCCVDKEKKKNNSLLLPISGFRCCY